MFKLLQHFLSSLVLSLVFFNSIVVESSEYEDEELYEILKSANLRASPDLSAPVISVIHGGYVVSAANGQSKDGQWQGVRNPYNPAETGYVHKSLIKTPSFSYVLKQIENFGLKIKYFSVDPGNWGYVVPFTFARIYAEDGAYLGFLPDTRDLSWVVGNPWRLRLENLESDFPYFQVRNDSGGAHCCSSYRYFSKSPLFSRAFDFDSRVHDGWERGPGDEWVASVIDETYAYWFIGGNAYFSYGGSPFPLVKLRLGDQGIEVNSKLMFKEPPDRLSLEQLALEIGTLDQGKSEDALSKVGRLSQKMLDLIYSGNSESAFELLNLVWTDGFLLDVDEGIDRAYFRRRLEESVRTSKYYQSWMLSDQ